MKKFGMLLLAIIFTFGMALSAQDTPPPKHKNWDKKEMRKGEKKQLSAEQRADFMAKQLELSDAEKAKVQALFEKQDAKHKQQMEEMKKMREEQKVKFEADKKARDADLIKIIGNEKFQKLQAMQIEHLKKMNRMKSMKMKKDCPNCDQKGQLKEKKMMKKHMMNEKVESEKVL